MNKKLNHNSIKFFRAQYFEDVPDEVRSKDIYRSVFYPFLHFEFNFILFFFSLNNRISLLEDLLEHLVKNMDSILKRVENELRKSKKE